MLKYPKYEELFSRCEYYHAMISNDIVNICECKTVQGLDLTKQYLAAFINSAAVNAVKTN